MGFLKDIKEDIKNNKSFKGRIIVVSYTITSFFRKRAKNKFALILIAPIIIFYKLITDIILGCEIPASTKIGRGLIIHHGRATVLNKNVVIGNNVTLKHNTTIGSKTDLEDQDLGSPNIEDKVVIEPHSIIIGPITIGKNAIVGAGSVVIKDVEPYSIVAGNPARLIRKIEID
ncbi:serine acetyltransferase [Hyunsoonleella aestuarii]|uniref:Serine acetyltransferase n=1 Tax=Hyunsoonleella aestuarii TaxID=912802 RepID=A0ABP8E963_9FLAO|nr:serine acetyltransferase [Hyunsoonleella aestuarii]